MAVKVGAILAFILSINFPKFVFLWEKNHIFNVASSNISHLNPKYGAVHVTLYVCI